MEESHARAGDHRLFEFLAASKPEREHGSAAAAVAASVGGHILVIGLVAWATVAAAHRVWTTAAGPDHDDFVVLLSPGQLEKATSSHALAHAPDPDVTVKHARYVAHAHAPGAQRDALSRQRDVPPASADMEAAPSADPIRTAVKIMPAMPAVDPASDIDAITRHADQVLASIHQSEYGGIGQDSASTRVAAIVDDHHEPTVEELAEEEPHIGAFTSLPEMTNPEQVQRVLSRDYPSFLKDNGVGGRVLLWFLVDEYGHVKRWLLKRSSGHAALDKVALKDAAYVRFKPAWNYDRHVPLWIVLPITFMVDES